VASTLSTTSVWHPLPSTVAWDPLPSTAASSVAPQGLATFYAVYPTNTKNATEIAETEAYLKTLFDPDDVLANNNAEGTVSWRVTVNDNAIIDHLKTHPGVREVEPEPTPPYQVQEEPSKARRSELETGAPRLYYASARDPKNKKETTETKQFLAKTILGKDKFISEVMMEGMVYAWGALPLDSSGFKKVQGYKGIRGIEEQPEMLPNLVLPGAEKEPNKSRQHTDRAIDSRGAKLRRALSWKLQGNAQPDLVIDSIPR
jgi:hypothetical protein